jgi:flagellar export protein FliJ
MSASGFNYSLQALLRMRDAELGGARDGLAAARRQVEERARKLRDQLDRVLQLEQQGRELVTPGTSINPDATQRVLRYLALERVEARKRQSEADEAKQGETQALERWRVARQAVRILERHRDALASTFEIDQARREQRRVDELYLLSRASLQTQTTGSRLTPGGTHISAIRESDK